MGFRLKSKRRVPRQFADHHKFCTLAVKLLPQGHILTMREAGGECTVCLNGDVLHCEYHRGGRGVAIGARQAVNVANIAGIMYAARLRFEEQASMAAGHVGRS